MLRFLAMFFIAYFLAGIYLYTDGWLMQFTWAKESLMAAFFLALGSIVLSKLVDNDVTSYRR